MTSNINPANIDGAYPVAGQDNNSQGFRTNFTNIAQNFQYAANEITDLQNKAVLKSALTGSTLNNNMNGAILSGAQIQDFSETVVSLGTQTGTVIVDYTTGHYQTVTTAGPISLNFLGWPATGQMGWITVQISVANVAHTVTFPSSVSVNAQGIQGLNVSTDVITFATTGIYTFTFTTINNGTTITINESNKALQPYNASSERITTSGAALSLGVTTSYFTAGGTATLGAGVSGQIKVLTQTASASMVITVANAGWGGSGTVTINAMGESCTLQFTNGNWYAIGQNGATFA